MKGAATVESNLGNVYRVELHWGRSPWCRQESIQSETRVAMTAMKEQARYVVCITDEGDEWSVLKGKLDRVLPPEENDPPQWLRVVDETEEDYLYDASWFVEVALLEAAVAALTPSEAA